MDTSIITTNKNYIMSFVRFVCWTCVSSQNYMFSRIETWFGVVFASVLAVNLDAGNGNTRAGKINRGRLFNKR